MAEAANERSNDNGARNGQPPAQRNGQNGGQPTQGMQGSQNEQAGNQENGQNKTQNQQQPTKSGVGNDLVHFNNDFIIKSLG